MFRAGDFPDLLVGLAAADDAAVYRLNETQAIIATTDFFPPVVDDPYDFGAIAAANALSDIYAMGGEVLFAVNLVAFPDTLDMSILGDILRGGAATVAEAGGIIAERLVGIGVWDVHGLAAIGLVHPDAILRKSGAQPGDSLVLTKPLGVGVITTALKREQATADHVASAVRSMKQLNRAAARAASAAPAHAMTDITGFGLLGHAHEMAQQSGVDFRLRLSALPWLPGAPDYGAAGAFPGGMGNNAVHFGPHVRFAEGISLLFQDLLFTPETSGGLLVALDPGAVAAYVAQVPGAVEIGRVTAGTGQIYVEH